MKLFSLRLLLLTSLMAVATYLFSQNNEETLKDMPDPKTLDAKKNMAMGDKLFERGGIELGLRYYQEAVNKDSTKTIVFQKLADGYFQTRDYAAANKYYKLLLAAPSGKADLYSLYRLALTEKYLGNYQIAKTGFEKYMRMVGDDENQLADRSAALLEVQGCDLGLTLTGNASFRPYGVFVLDANINQPLTDFAPVLRDGNTLVLGRWIADDVVMENRREKYATFSRLYTAQKNGKVWGLAELLPGAVNDVKFHTGNACFSNDGKTMYYTQCYQDDYQRMFCNIYRSQWSGNVWGAGEKLDGGVNVDGATTTHPALGKNEVGEEGLYFASTRNPSTGFDIYYAKLNADGAFGKPKALGSAINTRGNEMTPFYDYSTNTLYFSSDGHVNIGGLDVFQSAIKEGKFSKAENLGVPVNSSVDDMYFSIYDKADIGFVVSNRPGGWALKSATCCDDVYGVYRNYLRLAVKGTLLFADETNQSVTGEFVNLIDAQTGASIKTVNAINGSYFFDLEPDKLYKVSAAKDGYFTATQNFSTENKTKSDTLSFTLSLKKMEKNKAYTLENIYYEFDKTALTAASKAVLDNLYNILKENPDIVIELSAHTDSKGSDKYNLDLSQKRAESCMNYLVKEKGISKKRVVAKGYGETVPVAHNENPDGSDNEDGRAKNRRTEFKIIGDTK